MRKLGFTVTEQVGKTGIIAIYRNGDGPTVLVRTEFDALPMEEISPSRAGHAWLMPDKSTDPMAIDAHFVSDVQTVISRERCPAPSA